MKSATVRSGDKRLAAIGDAEWDARVQLAAAFRISHRLGWNDGVNNHISARVPGEPDHFLMNPRALGWDEITASTVVKLDFNGKILDGSDNPPGRAGLNFHSAILKMKPQVGSVLHVHPKAGVVISATEDGLKIVDQNGCALLGKLAYHAFEGYASESDEGARIVEELGEKSAMLMWNHGLLTVGRNVAEAFGYMRRLVDACETQERLMATGAKIREITPKARARMEHEIAERRGNQTFGALEWEMFLRQAKRLDPSFAT
jgi:ribulose-5-phosphate 4-epimerase/fuculose-1-phosphate aldolase